MSAAAGSGKSDGGDGKIKERGGLSDTLLRYWDAYLAQLRAHPVRTKALTSAVLAAVADVSAQTLLGTKLTALNTKSIRNQMVFAFLIRGPGIHYWLEVLERVFVRLGLSDPVKDKANGGPPISTVLVRVCV